MKQDGFLLSSTWLVGRLIQSISDFVESTKQHTQEARLSIKYWIKSGKNRSTQNANVQQGKHQQENTSLAEFAVKKKNSSYNLLQEKLFLKGTKNPLLFLQFEADRRSIIITINSFGTELSKEDRAKLYPRRGKLYPDGLIELSRADDYETVKRIAECYAVKLSLTCCASAQECCHRKVKKVGDCVLFVPGPLKEKCHENLDVFVAGCCWFPVLGGLNIQATKK